MQYSSLFGLTAFLALANASPVPSTAVVNFIGAAGAQYSVTVPLDGTLTYTNNVLSISTISSSIDVDAQCTLDTVDQDPVLVEGPPGTWAVGPPQTVISISCTSSYTPPSSPSSITIEFDGADPSQGAFYTLTVPLDGTVVNTNNALSISTLVSTFADLPTKCYFHYVDFQAALVLIRANTWAVGPPQTITSVKCTA